MSRKEVPRAGLVKAALAGKVTNQEGARALRLSVRQFKRLKVRVRREGARGLMHRRRGRPSPRRVPAALRAHLTEKLQQDHALPISRATVRRIRRALGRPPQRRLSRRTARTPRWPPRRPHSGHSPRRAAGARAHVRALAPERSRPRAPTRAASAARQGHATANGGRGPGAHAERAAHPGRALPRHRPA
jgi:hypothetical protein